MSKISLILWQKASAEVVWLFLIRSVSSKKKPAAFEFKGMRERIQSWTLDKIIEKKTCKAVDLGYSD